MVPRREEDAAFSERQRRVVFEPVTSNKLYTQKKRKEVKLIRTAQPYEIFTFREMYFSSVQTGTSRICAAVFRMAI